MHQSSFRILRWTGDNRPYTKDFQDLFCTLMVALPLDRHRVGPTWKKRNHTFTTAEALTHLSNLRFTQSNRRPSPEDPNITVTTKIATTFSMVPHMAKLLLNKFLAARFVESCENQTEFLQPDRVWQLTPKGISLLQSFAQRNGVHEQHIFSLLTSSRNNVHLLVLERDAQTDQLNHDRATVEVVFRRFIGMESLTARSNTSASDTDSLNESHNGVAGVKMSQRKVGSRSYPDAFTGKAAVDWLLNCCTMADVREAEEILRLFHQYNLIVCLKDARTEEEKVTLSFPVTKGCIHMMTSEGHLCARQAAGHQGLVGNDVQKPQGSIRDSNTSRMTSIISTPSLRLLFREFLRDTHCEENLVFYSEVKDFLGRWGTSIERQRDGGMPSLDAIRETLAAAYGKSHDVSARHMLINVDLYNAFLAPGSPCELNIEHNLRNALVCRMTKFELPDEELLSTVNEVIDLYTKAQVSVFKLMASDSVPKFLRDPKYAQALYENQILETSPNGVMPQPARQTAVVAS